MRQASREPDAAQALAKRLRERRGEIEEAALLRVKALADLPSGSGPEYAQGLREAVAVALDYGIEGIEGGEDSATLVPAELLAQARLAAASGVGLDVVLRRYVAGQALLGDFVVQEAGGISTGELKRLLRCLAAITDGLLCGVSSAYAEERERRTKSAGRQRTERIERLLAGEPLDTSGLGWDFDAFHLGLAASGPGAEQALSGIAASLGTRLLSVPRAGDLRWAWLGTGRLLDPERTRELAETELPAGLVLSIGEPAEGLAGWRLTHRQAAAALAVAERGAEPVVRYAEVALLASVLQDELLTSSLWRLYIEPLAATAGGGGELRETLRAYISTGGNTSSSAAALRVDRRTVTRRIRMIEEILGQALTARVADVQMALRLWDFDEFSPFHEGTKWDSSPRHRHQFDQAHRPPH